MIPILRCIVISTALSLTACSVAPRPVLSEKAAERELGERVVADPELAVLFVGNSYSFGVPRRFSKLAASRGREVRVDRAAASGWTLARHSTDEGTLEKIRGGRWDVVVLQEQSRTPSLPGWRRRMRMDRPLGKLASEVRATGAVPVIYQTWGRRDGDPRRRGDDFRKMSDRLREGCREAARTAGGMVVVPVGDAWEKEFDEKGGDLFMPDGSHPSPEGDRLTAEVFYRAFYHK